MRKMAFSVAASILLSAPCMSFSQVATGDSNGSTKSGNKQAASSAIQSVQTIPEKPFLEQPIHIVPFVTPDSAAPVAALAIPGAHINYFGGPVISNVHVVQVLYGSGSYLAKVSSTTPPSMASFFTDVTQSSYFDLLSEYHTVSVAPVDGGASSNQTIGHGFFDGQFTINPTPANNGAVITDAQIQNELLSQVAAGHLPVPVVDAQGNTNTLYMIYFPAGKTITLGNLSSCVNGGFCGYHNSTSGTFGSKRLYYGVLPDTQPPSACSSLGCGSTDPFTNAMNVSSHELAEAVTDPDVGPATTLVRPLAWVDPVNSEIADICAGQLASAQVGPFSYTVQRVFSNFQNDCVSTLSQFQLTGGFTVVPGQKFDLPVSLQTSAGSAISGYTGTVHFTSSDPGAVLPADYTFNSADAGVHTFIVSLNTLGTQTITATDPNSPVLSGNSAYTVIAGGASIFNVAEPSNATLGVSVPVVVAARAGFPNNEVVTSYTGTVHFSSSDANAVLPPDSKLPGGMATFSVTFNTAGSQTLTVKDVANSLLAGSSGSFVASAPPNPTATTVAANINPTTFGQTVTFTASVTQQGSPVAIGEVDFKADGVNFASAPMDSLGHAQVTATLQGGPHTVFAEYVLGTAANPNSSSSPLSLLVNPVPTTIVASSTPSPSNFGDRVNIVAQISSALNGTSGGFVTFTDNGAPLAILPAAGGSTGIADTSLPVGSHTIIASYSGTADFAPSTSAAVVQVVNPAAPRDYKIQADKNSVTILAGQSATFFLSTTSVNGFNGSVKFACNNLPAFTTCTFAPTTAFVSPASPVANTTLTVKTTGPHASLVFPGLKSERDHSAYAAFWVAGPFVVAMVLLAGPRSKKRRNAFMVVLVLLLVFGALTSCGGGGSTTPPPPPPPPVTPPGTSSFAVSATGTPTTGSPGAANPNQQLNISITVQP